MKILHDLDLSTYLSFRTGPVLNKVHVIEEEKELTDLLKGSDEEFRMLGKGTNTLIGTEQGNRRWLINGMEGWKILSDDPGSVLLRVRSGTLLDPFIREMCVKGAGGLESLSGIPGTAGGAVIMNAGAYGHEIGEVVERVRVFDRNDDTVHILPSESLAFGYRQSIFQKDPARWFLITLDLKLKKMGREELLEKRREVLAQRSIRVPALKEAPSCGSFFRNPLIPRKEAEELQRRVPELKSYPMGEDMVKVSAGSLIRHVYPVETVLHGIRISPEHPLILVNVSASYEDALRAVEEVTARIREKTGIKLRPEVQFA